MKNIIYLMLFLSNFLIFCTYQNKEKIKKDEVKHENIILSEYCDEVSLKDSITVTFLGKFEKTKVKIVLDDFTFIDENVTTPKWGVNVDTSTF